MQRLLSSAFPALITIAFLLLQHGLAKSSDQQRPLLQNEVSPCPDHRYTVHLFSKDPLIIYISNFITEEEASHLERITKQQFTQSEVVDESGRRLGNATTRTSRSTSPRRDDIIRCIEDRALAFQGLHLPRSQLEPLQLVRYTLGEEYQAHTDWFESPSQTTPELGGNRLTSFFVYVAVSSDITGGGTNFPLLDAPGNDDEKWCRFLNCDEPWEAGVTFRPIVRNAIFWQNLHLKDGTGDRRTLHAGLPLTSGEKLGMNIWTRERPLSSKYRGED